MSSQTPTPQDWDKVYSEGRDIWTVKGALPRFLRENVEIAREKKERGSLRWLTVLDIGCGKGYYAEKIAYTACDVHGIDLSREAIREANDRIKGMSADFKPRLRRGNFLTYNPIFRKFEFVYDWTTFHHINPSQHERYKEKLLEIMHSQGQYAMCCLSYIDKWFASGNDIVAGDSGMPLYRNSPKHIQDLFLPELGIVRFEHSWFGGMFPEHALKGKPPEALERKFDQYLFQRR